MSIKQILAVALIYLIVPCCAFAEDGESKQSSNLMLILDASGSMWGQIKGESKVETARKVLGNVIGNLSDSSQVGLIAYGHRQKEDCGDIESIVPLGPIDKKLLVEQIGKLIPKGKTPITAAVNEAIKAVRDREEATTILLISDGLETCEGDPCKAVQLAKESGVKFVMHVVGFDVEKENVAQLECVAQAGGGMYLSAQDAQELQVALDMTAQAPAALPDSRLSIKVVADSKLSDAIIRVYPAGSTEEILHARSYTSKETNPRMFPLEPGDYDVKVQVLGMKGEIVQIFKQLSLPKGETIEKVADFSAGELAVKVTKNGKLSDATVSVYEAGTKNLVTSGRTYQNNKSNPKVFRISPGQYDLVIGALEIGGKPEATFKSVAVEGGKQALKEQEFVSGRLRVRATDSGKLVDAVVSVADPSSGVSVNGRTYTSANSNPKEFELPPGEYQLKVRAVSAKDKASQEMNVKVEAGQVVDKSVDFNAAG